MLHLLSPGPEADIFNSLLTWLLHHLAPESGPASGVTSGHLDTFSFGWMMESLNRLCLVLECLSVDLLATPPLLSHVREL